MDRCASLCFLMLLALGGIATPRAEAQQPEENPATAAWDAFGTSLGGESIGLYQSGSVRGFSPIAAGNIRLEGLYIDRQADFTGRLIAGSRIRVGLSTLSYPFPAPTGIVDYRLRLPEDTPSLRVAPQGNSHGGTQLEIDGSTPLAAGKLGLAAGGGIYAHRYPDGGDAFVTSIALVPRWTAGEGITVVPFWSRIDTHDMDVTPVVVVDGAHLPPAVPRDRFLGQTWAGLDRVRTNTGVLATVERGAWEARAGYFRSTERPERSVSLLFLDTRPDGTARRSAVANPPQRYASSSGEVRLSRILGPPDRPQAVHVSLRGRDQTRRYGGAHPVDLGWTSLSEASTVPEPDFEFGPQTVDAVRQWTGSVAYAGLWPGIGEGSVAVQRARYRKRVTRPGGALPASRDDPWLVQGAGALHLRPSVAAYVTFAQGLEESPVAPETAVNRDEAPPAIQTRQVDFGVRWQAPFGARLVAGAFRVQKPHHAMDSARIFRRLGEQRHQGIELSVSGMPTPGLSVIAGAVLLSARVKGERVESGEIGRRPVGTSGSTLMTVFDYRAATTSPLSLDLAVDRTGRRVANLANTLDVPALTVVDLGARYRFQAGRMPGTVRVRVTNLFDRYAWSVRGNGAFAPNPPRQLTVRVTVDP